MTPVDSVQSTLDVLDDATRGLVRLSAVVTAGSDVAIRTALSAETRPIPGAWVDELLLQTYLFAGFPRALNAMREWRRVDRERGGCLANDFVPCGGSPPDVDRWSADGRITCRAVYGPMYDKLRQNVRALDPLLDEWMITEGYGKVLSRPGLDLPRRELCIVAACAAAEQDRQLHSHLHGAKNVGVAPHVLDDVIEALAEVIGPDRTQTLRLLWARVRGK